MGEQQMPILTVPFEVFCTCGEGLCMQTITRCSRGRLMPQVVVEPCSKCGDKRYREGYVKGHDAGMESRL
jgi:hypothetical protein